MIREAIEGVKVAKMQVWEDAYVEAIRRKRSKEADELRRVRVLITLIMTTGRLSPLLGFAVTVVISWAIHGSLSADVVFPMCERRPSPLGRQRRGLLASSDSVLARCVGVAGCSSSWRCASPSSCCPSPSSSSCR